MRDADFERYAELTDKLNKIGDPPCHQDPAVFYPEDFFDEENKAIAIAEAKKLCASCPALTLCADYAVRAREPFGIWGGLTHKDRKAVSGQL
jgi:WhiB family redox-sensing transcriptional regulator|tara:strand:+ start:5971 stop:6246 length:276 start_codon:yes stop_codon:yes gene_type:complete